MQYRQIRNIFPESFGELENPPVGASLPWMPKITEFMGGLRPREITLLCAPTGSGKTELIATMAAQLGFTGIPTFVAPIETGDIDFTNRIIAVAARKNLNHGLKVPADELTQIKTKYGDKLDKMPIFVANYNNRVGVDELLGVLEIAHEEHGIQIALLDNLNFFLEVVSSDREKMELDNAIHKMVMFVKRVPIHILLIVHPKKTDGGRVESEFDIKGSSTAVQECANVALFNRPTKEQIELGRDQNHRELIFRKIRKRGFYVNKSIWLSYLDGHYSELLDAATKHHSSSRTGQRYVPPGCD